MQKYRLVVDYQDDLTKEEREVAKELVISRADYAHHVFNGSYIAIEWDLDVDPEFQYLQDFVDDLLRLQVDGDTSDSFIILFWW